MALESSIYADKGLTGLSNVGNSCYINACMQILSHTYKLSDFLKDASYKAHLNRKPDSIILLEWANLLDLMWSKNCTIAPMRFINSIKKVSAIKNMDMFSGNDQNDAQEFLLFIIDCFHNSIRREVDMKITGNAVNNTDKLAITCYNMMQKMYSKDYSEMLQLFYGIQVSVVFSFDETKQNSLNPEPFSVLSLSIPDIRSPTIFDCLDMYCKKETLTADNQWFNDETNKYEDAKRGYIFWSLPDILIIDIKRWGHNRNKLSTVVSTELTHVDFSKYVHGYNKENYVYDLYGVCNHIGGTLGGHYTANIKNANNKWYEFNDTIVKEISENDIVSHKSYCFFYRKIK
jgi:ubiquitin carboxyl-terminal hydrolase 8